MPYRVQRVPGLEWGVATATMPGEKESADQHIVQATPSGVLIAVVDGIGHGEAARAAAKRAIEVVSREARRGAVAVVRLCHAALLGTRGVVMSVASIDYDEDTVTWMGVGNVAGLLVRGDPHATPPREEMFVRGGVVGSHLPLLQASVVSVALGDALVMSTDGVRLDFGENLSARMAPTRLADHLLEAHGQGTDDSLVLVARYLGRDSLDDR